MSSNSFDSFDFGISDFELKSLAQLGAESQRRIGYPPLQLEYPPYGLDEADRAKWEAEQEIKKQEDLAERAKQEAEDELRRKEANDRFKAALNERMWKAYDQGGDDTLSREARRAVSVRSYVLLGVVAAVVSMPLIGMLLQLDPQAFGAYIAPVTGITGTIVGYWFGTVGQGTTGQGVAGQGSAQPSRGRSSRTKTG